MLSITEENFLASPKRILERLHTSRKIVNVTSDQGGYVIIDSDEWSSICGTIYLNGIEGLADSILKSSHEPLDESIPLDSLDW